MPVIDDQNADALLDVKFYEYQGDDQFKGVLHIRIITPGDKIAINDRPAREDDKRRFQRQWLNYQMANGTTDVVGTSLLTWRTERPEELSDGQLQELQILHFLTVEQLAMASDMQISRIGMGAVGLRERARSYLSSKNAQASGAELQETKAEVVALKAMMAEQNAMMVKLLETKTAPAAPAKRKGGGGWNKGMKLKKDKSADAQHADAPAGSASL